MVSMGGFAGEDMSRIGRPHGLRRSVFTFGGAHRDAAGNSLGRRYVVIEGSSGLDCRATMLNHFGRKWAFQYQSEESAGVDMYGLTEYPREEWPESSGRWFVANGELCERTAESAVAASDGPTLPEVPADPGSSVSGEHVGPDGRPPVDPLTWLLSQ